MTDSHPYWCAALATAAGEAARMIDQRNEKAAKTYLREQLREYIASPCPAEETRVRLRPYLVGKK